jgi:hypothetical protein
MGRWGKDKCKTSKSRHVNSLQYEMKHNEYYYVELIFSGRRALILTSLLDRGSDDKRSYESFKKIYPKQLDKVGKIKRKRAARLPKVRRNKDFFADM